MLLYLRYLKGKRWAERILSEIPRVTLDPELVGVVDSVRVRFLIDFYPVNEDFTGEPGVSYLITADGTSILFDTGFNPAGEEPSPLMRNAEKMGVRLPDDADVIVISHMHLDHIGGLKNQLKRTFSLTPDEPDLTGKRAFVPVRMSHPSATVIVNETPTVISKGVLLTEPLPSMLYFMGRTLEQALVVNLKDRGLVVIVGCGHQKIVNLLHYLEKLLPLPVYALIGGVHLPVTESREVRFGLPVQRILGTGKPPWDPPNRRDVDELIRFLKEKNVKKVGISAHDSCDYTIGKFREVWGDDYIEVKAGSEIVL